MLPGPPRSKDIFKGALSDRSVTGPEWAHVSEVSDLVPTHVMTPVHCTVIAVDCYGLHGQQAA